MIEFKNVNMVYKTNGVVALDNVSVRIEDGEFVFVVGASGAGKSSFLNVIMGQEKVDSGNVIVGPFNLAKMKKKELPYLRRMLGIVFQDFRLIPTMTVYDNVAFALRVIGLGERIIRKRVRYVLRLVDLSAKAKNLPNQLSTGERQRVAIARALVNNPGIIIADEPTGNLDPVLSGEIMTLFDKINSLGATVVVVTHDLELVHQFDHRIVTIENGKIVSDQPAKVAPKPTSQQQRATDIPKVTIIPSKPKVTAVAVKPPQEEAPAAPVSKPQPADDAPTPIATPPKPIQIQEPVSESPADDTAARPAEDAADVSPAATTTTEEVSDNG